MTQHCRTHRTRTQTPSRDTCSQHLSSRRGREEKLCGWEQIQNWLGLNSKVLGTPKKGNSMDTEEKCKSVPTSDQSQNFKGVFLAGEG